MAKVGKGLTNQWCVGIVVKFGRANHAAKPQTCARFGSEQQTVHCAFHRFMTCDIYAIGIKWILRSEELGERPKCSFVRGKNTIAGSGPERVKIDQVANQRNIQHFADLLEIVVFVYQLERLGRVVEAFVCPVRKGVCTVGDQSFPAVSIAGKTSRFGEIFIVGVGDEQ